MAQILDPLPPQHSGEILCCYVNATSKIQVARISNIPNWYFERVIFPGQRLVFETPQEALMEIHTGTIASQVLSDTISCDRLAISEPNEHELDLEPINNHLIVQSINKKTNDNTKPLQIAPISIY